MIYLSAYDLQQMLIRKLKSWKMPSANGWKWGEGKYQPERVAESGSTITGRFNHETNTNSNQ